MNTFQLDSCMKQDHILAQQCIGVFPIDKIPKIKAIPVGMIVNLDEAHLPGSHWIGIYIDSDTFGIFFDSYGRNPEKKAILNLLKDNCIDWTYSDKCLQSPLSSTCGQYSLYFLYHIVRNLNLKRIVDDKFSMNLIKNDSIVTSWVNKKFSVKTEIFNETFVINQIARALLSE